MSRIAGVQILFGLVLAMLQGCAAGVNPQADVCQEAVSYLAECGVVETTLGGACDSDQSAAARSLLDMSCSELQLVTAEPGKGDFWSGGNPLCGFMVGARDIPQEGLCCFDRNCAGDLVCNGYRCSERASHGGACDRDGHCVEALVCGPDDTCVEPRDAGQSCTRDSSCDGDLRCVSGLCAAPSTAGEHCDEGDDSDCASGLVCWESECRARSVEGGACEDQFDCEFDFACVAGLCVTQPGVGDSCDVGDIGDCPIGLECIAGTCQEEPSLGDACEREPRGMCGRGNTCWDGVCVREHGLSGPCLDLFDCADGLFCIEGRCMP